MFRRFLPLSAFSLVVAGCGGGAGPHIPQPGPPEPPEPPEPEASAGGLWQGTSSLGFGVVGLVSESGRFHFIQDDGVQLVGTITTSQDELSANFVGYVPFREKLGDGSTTGVGSGTAVGGGGIGVGTTVGTISATGACAPPTRVADADCVPRATSTLSANWGSSLLALDVPR